MTAPFTLPVGGGTGKNVDPFAVIGDVHLEQSASTDHSDPFQHIGDVAAPGVAPRRLFDSLPENERRVHLDRMLRAQTANDADPTLREQLVSGAKSAYQGVRHLPTTLVNMAGHAAEDLGTVSDAMNAGMGQANTLTPESAKKVPLAMLNTAALPLYAMAPEMSLPIRAGVNATLGALNDPEQPARGATAGLLLGETLHQVPKLIPSRVQPPQIRLDQTSEPLRNAAFAQRLEDGAHSANARGVEPVEGYEPTAQPNRFTNPNPRNPQGFQAGADPFADIGDVKPSLGKQKPIETEPLSAGLERQAGEGRAAITDRYAAEDVRSEALTRQAALRALTGIRRRPGGVPLGDSNPNAPTLPLGSVLPSELAGQSAVGGAAFEPPVEAMGAKSAATEPYREGFAMGGAESRVPDFTVPRLRGSDPATLPAGVTPETAALAKQVAPNPYRQHTNEQLAHAAMDEQHAIEQAQQNLAMDGEGSMQNDENTGNSISDQTPEYRNKGLTLQRSLGRMAKIEREFALRGLQGQELADVMQAARERRMETQGEDADLRTGMSPGRTRITDDPFSEIGDTVPDVLPGDGAVVAPHGTPRPLRDGETLVNRDKFSPDPSIQSQLAESERALLAKGQGKRLVPFSEGQGRARTFAETMGVDPKSIDLSKAAQFSGEQIVGLQHAAQQRMAQIAELSKRLADPTLPDAQRHEIGALIDSAKEAREQLIDAVSKGRSQKGRDLNFLKQMTEHSLDPDVWETQARKLAGDRVLSDETVADIRRLAREAHAICGGA